MITFIYFLASIKKLTTRQKYIKLSINWLSFFFLISKKLESIKNVVFFNKPLALIITKICFLNIKDGLETSFCFDFNVFCKYFVLEN